MVAVLAALSGCSLVNALDTAPDAEPNTAPDAGVSIAPDAGQRADGAVTIRDARADAGPTPGCGLEVDSRLVVDQPVVVPYHNSRDEHVVGEGLLSGYLSDLVILDDRVVVVSYAGDSGEPVGRSAACRPIDVDHDYVPKTRIDTYDLRTMSTLTTTIGPACLHGLVAAPSGDGFIGTFRADPRGNRFRPPVFRIGQFDAEGALTRSASIAEGLEPEWRNASWYFSVVDVQRSSDAGRLLVMIDAPATGTPPTNTGPLSGRLFVLDPRDLSERARSKPLEQTFVLSIAPTPRGVWLVDEAQRRRWLFADQSASLIDDGYRDELGPRPLHVLHHATSGQLVIASAGPAPSVMIIGDTVTTISTTLDVTETHPAPDVASQVLVALVRHAATDPALPDRFAYLGRVEVDDGTLSRCRQRIGFGVIRKMRTDHLGQVWMILPWEGKIVRVAAP